MSKQTLQTTSHSGATDGGNSLTRSFVLHRNPGFVSKLVLCSLAAVFSLASVSEAVLTQTFSDSGTTVASEDSRPISASAEFKINRFAGTITLTLTNLTVDPERSNQLLTGFSFSLVDANGAVNNLSLTSATTIGRVVNSDGTYYDTGSVNLLSPKTWKMGDNELISDPEHDPSGGSYNISFHPNAQYGIIGSPGDNNTYDGATDPNGQSPYSAETATFVFKSANPNLLDASTAIDRVTFYFGTDFQSSLSPVPEGSAVLPFVGVAALAGLMMRRRQRVLTA